MPSTQKKGYLGSQPSMVEFTVTVWTQCYLTNHDTPPFKIILLNYAQIFTVFPAIYFPQIIDLHMLINMVSRIWLCKTRLQWLAISYVEERKIWHWFHHEHDIHRRDVCCYTLDHRKLQYYQYHVSFCSLLEYISISDVIYYVTSMCRRFTPFI